MELKLIKIKLQLTDSTTGAHGIAQKFLQEFFKKHYVAISQKYVRIAGRITYNKI